MNNKILECKQNKVSTLTNDIKESKSLVIFHYQGLSGKGMTELRRKLHNANAKVHISKNNIFNRSLKEANVGEFSEIVGPSAIITAKGDEVAPFKELNDVMKSVKSIKFVDGLLEGKHVDAAQFAQVANLPSREGLLSMLLSALQGNIRMLACGINAIGEKK